MNIDQLHSLLRDVASGTLSPAAAIAGVQRLAQGLEDLRVDPGRLERTGVGEVIYGQGKPVDQIRMAMAELANHHPVLATRLSLEHGRELARTFPSGHLWEEAGLFCLGRNLEAADPKAPNSDLLIVTAGSTDLPVAREALGVARFLGLSASLVSDVGVAGLHRLMPHLGTLRQAKVLIAVAGMEGALPSVLGGLVKAPIIAVPTSTGYGANFAGLAPLLAMLNSCAPGVGVVNIDNGFGAAVLAKKILDGYA
ncbi:MAG: nickel pincer cofactor biosynthesis protein LarB [Desulfovibrionales bacterium]|nr:nickel pincer cofactor biosynthesis protein LarB [Desulfovibrionales bacterium]